jgi:hypothetical protein
MRVNIHNGYTYIADITKLYAMLVNDIGKV